MDTKAPGPQPTDKEKIADALSPARGTLSLYLDSESLPAVLRVIDSSGVAALLKKGIDGL
jgi:hypothetical protein